jgi:orotidine-5'-phosphate decarboxylase
LTREEIFEQILLKRSFLCIGLDTDIEKIPAHLHQFPDPIFEFNRQIVNATQDLCVAYKINTAFYESLGAQGWSTMTKTLNHIPKNIFTIADAKRGDIGNTSRMYAKAFFDEAASGLSFDAITVAPYMGQDSVTPFLGYKEKWVILLALTSNEGSRDFQWLETNGEKLFEAVIRKSREWGDGNNMMYVVGATHPSQFKKIRALVPDHFLLVPGVGTQGGDLRQVAINGFNKHCGLLINSSRNIIYASKEKTFATDARAEALKISNEMNDLLELIAVQ